MKWLAGVVGGLVLMGTAWAGLEGVNLTLPWKTFSEAAKDGKISGMGACRTGDTTEIEVLATRLEHQEGARTDAYMYWYEFESGRIVFVVYVGNVDGATPDAVGFGTVDLKTPGAHDTIPSIRWEKFDPAKHITPCDFLVGPKKSDT